VSAQSRCLILGYDRTEGAQTAASWAARELRPEGKLVILHAARGQHLGASPLSTPEERHRFGRALIDELLLEGDNALHDVLIEAEVPDAEPVAALIDAAERHEAQAIVVGAQRHSPLRKALGTVTSELLQSAPVPVVAIPETMRFAREPAAES
jgi:nucleotide-binding universal stress UspA family protein